MPFFPSMKTPIVNPSMPSRIMGSGGGGQSELATKKAALEDDGAGNLQYNIQYTELLLVFYSNFFPSFSFFPISYLIQILLNFLSSFQPLSASKTFLFLILLCSLSISVIFLFLILLLFVFLNIIRLDQPSEYSKV